VPTRSGRPPTRFRDGACHPAGSLSISALPPDANGRVSTAEDGEIESQRFHARPLSKRCQHPDWFILQSGRRSSRSPCPRRTRTR
jgi:hypothetical protein